MSVGIERMEKLQVDNKELKSRRHDMIWIWNNIGWISLVWCGLIVISVFLWSRLPWEDEPPRYLPGDWMPDIDDVELEDYKYRGCGG